jgi:predicted outer membrane repeat protein
MSITEKLDLIKSNIVECSSNSTAAVKVLPSEYQNGQIQSRMLFKSVQVKTKIVDTNFTRNSGEYGGAINIEDILLLVDRTSFIENKAI